MLSYSDIKKIWDSHADEAESKGMEKGKAEVFRNFFNAGASIEFIAKAQNISEDEVRRILDIE